MKLESFFSKRCANTQGQEVPENNKEHFYIYLLFKFRQNIAKVMIEKNFSFFGSASLDKSISKHFAKSFGVDVTNTGFLGHVGTELYSQQGFRQP